MKLNLGEKLRNLRKTANMTQEQLADRLGVSCQAINRWTAKEDWGEPCNYLPKPQEERMLFIYSEAWRCCCIYPFRNCAEITFELQLSKTLISCG